MSQQYDPSFEPQLDESISAPASPAAGSSTGAARGGPGATSGVDSARAGSALSDPSDLPDARPVALSLVKAVQAARLYPADNPAYLRAKRGFDESLHDFLLDRSSIRFVVGAHSIYFGGEPVLNREHSASLAEGLHRDGIREIAFHHGMTGAESLGFLSIFRHSELNPSASEDIATLLWEKKFPHITYVAIDELFDPSADAESIPAEFGRDFMSHVERDVYEFTDDSDTDTDIRAKAAEAAERVLDQVRNSDVELFAVSDAERATILQEIEEESQLPRMRQDFSRILVEVLLLETNVSEFIDLVGTVSSALKDRIHEGHLHEAGWLLSSLVRISNAGGRVPEEVTLALKQAIESAWSPDCRGAIREKLDEGQYEAVSGLSAFLDAVPAAHLHHVCMMLGKLETATARRRLIDLLAKRCRKDTRPLLPFLEDKRWYLVRNVLFIMGRSGDRKCIPHVEPLLHHEEMRVRREALAAIDRLDPARCGLLLREALVDRESRIRIFAAGHLATRGPAAAPMLLKTIMDKNFEKRDPGEIAAFYDALAHTGGDEVVPYLAKVARRGNLLRRARTDAMRAAACRALGRVGGSEAETVLKDLLRDRADSVREAVEEALSRFDGGGSVNNSGQKEAA